MLMGLHWAKAVAIRGGSHLDAAAHLRKPPQAAHHPISVRASGKSEVFIPNSVFDQEGVHHTRKPHWIAASAAFRRCIVTITR